MEYRITHSDPITEEQALALVAEMGFHALAFDVVTPDDEELHWHEFDAVTWVISGTGVLEDEHGVRTEVGPGCHLQAPAGFLHRALAGDPYRVVLGTSLPYHEWTRPIDKDPSQRPAELVV